MKKTMMGICLDIASLDVLSPVRKNCYVIKLSGKFILQNHKKFLTLIQIMANISNADILEF